jgi:NAD-dependent dihydropyrimidine dehydrogenase PreA subunit
MEWEEEVRMYQDTYRRLAAHLDRLPGGFGSKDEAIEQRLLRTLFTPQEAELAIHLSLERETAAAIGARADLAAAEAEERLATMAQKGLIMAVQSGEGRRLYQAIPFVVGIWELQLNRRDDEWLQSTADYWRTRRPRRPVGPPQMRTIPIGESVDRRLEVLPYESAEALVAVQERFAVAPCICRRTARLRGGGCDAPEESCLIFGDWADYYVETGRGRSVDRAEVMAILTRAEAANLVLQPSNSKEASFICTCCSCCCGLLSSLKRHPAPADVVANAFGAKYDPELCEDCGTCLERCPMGALTQGEGRVVLSAQRCIGCGLCVSTCPGGALALARKPASENTVPPDTWDETWRRIVRAQEEAV